MKSLNEEEIKDHIIKIVKSEGRPVSIGYLAKKLGLSWWPTFKLIADWLLEELQSKNPDILKTLQIVPLKTTKDWVLLPPRILISPTPKPSPR